MILEFPVCGLHSERQDSNKYKHGDVYRYGFSYSGPPQYMEKAFLDFRKQAEEDIRGEE